MVTKDTRTAANQPLPAAAGLPSGDEIDDLSIEYPSSDGEPMAENKWQYVAMTDTTSALENLFVHRPDVFVGSDMLMYYRMNDNATRVAPDVFVVFGAAGKHFRDSWIVWREGKAPDFVMEVASPSTWQRDAAEKRDIYAGMGVTEYWRFDPTGDFFSPELVGERLIDGEYRSIPLETDSDGVLWGRSTVLGLDICVLPGLDLRLYDPASGQWLLTHRESEEARLAAEASLQESEAALRTSETARDALEAENERLREQLRSLQSGQ